MYIHEAFPVFETTSVEKATLLRTYSAYTSYELSALRLGRLQVISVLPLSFPIENFPVLCSVVPSAFHYFPGKIILATEAQKVTFPLPTKLEKLQDCKLMPGACREAYTQDVYV